MSTIIDTLLIDAVTPECRLAFLHQSSVIDLQIYRPDNGPQVGDVILGRVKAVVPSIRGAFIDIGDKRDGFLSLGDSPLSEGEAVIVQIRSEAMAEKGARLTARVSLAGRFAVYTPDQPGINISRKGTDPDLADLAVEKARPVIEPGDGAIIRTAALRAGPNGIEQAVHELIELRDAWLDAKVLPSTIKPPYSLIHAPDPVLQALQGIDSEHVRRLVIEGADAFARAKEYLTSHDPALLDRLALHQGPEGLFAHEGVEAALDGAISPTVSLPSGGSLHIRETPACVTVDVDTDSATNSRGGKAGKKGQALIRQTNQEAAKALAQELRLRNLSGNMVVDFIHDGDREAGRALLEALKAACADDPVPVTVEGFTRLGLVELTRRRWSRSLTDVLVNGEMERPMSSGLDKSPETLAYEALRRLIHVSQATPGRALTVRAGPPVIRLLENRMRTALQDTKERIGVQVTLKSDEAMPRGIVDVYS